MQPKKKRLWFSLVTNTKDKLFAYTLFEMLWWFILHGDAFCVRCGSSTLRLSGFSLDSPYGGRCGLNIHLLDVGTQTKKTLYPITLVDSWQCPPCTVRETAWKVDSSEIRCNRIFKYEYQRLIRQNLRRTALNQGHILLSELLLDTWFQRCLLL